MFIDLSKAFHAVDHEISLSKLKKYGMNWFLDWFISYLSNRSQCVSFHNNYYSLIIIQSLVVYHKDLF